MPESEAYCPWPFKRGEAKAGVSFSYKFSIVSFIILYLSKVSIFPAITRRFVLLRYVCTLAAYFLGIFVFATVVGEFVILMHALFEITLCALSFPLASSLCLATSAGDQTDPTVIVQCKSRRDKVSDCCCGLLCRKLCVEIMGVGRGCSGGSRPPWFLKFDIFPVNVSAEKWFCLSFKLVKWNFAIVGCF